MDNYFDEKKKKGTTAQRRSGATAKWNSKKSGNSARFAVKILSLL